MYMVFDPFDLLYQKSHRPGAAELPKALRS
jgi:hypothetical protein